MAALREYILSVVAAAILCGIVTGLIDKKGSCAPVVKLICGVFLTLTVVRPVAKVNIDDFMDFTWNLRSEADAAAAFGEEMYTQSLIDGIKQTTQSYILDKVQTLGLQLRVTVHLDSDLVPDEVTLEGAHSPYEKQQLQAFIASDLGIPKERQIWIG